MKNKKQIKKDVETVVRGMIREFDLKKDWVDTHTEKEIQAAVDKDTKHRMEALFDKNIDTFYSHFFNFLYSRYMWLVCKQYPNWTFEERDYMASENAWAVADGTFGIDDEEV